MSLSKGNSKTFSWYFQNDFLPFMSTTQVWKQRLLFCSNLKNTMQDVDARLVAITTFAVWYAEFSTSNIFVWVAWYYAKQIQLSY